MSEEQDKPLAAFEVVGDEALEARVVAWVLGEASAFEVEELERLCKDQPALEVFRRRLETVHGLAGESVAKPETDWKLPEEKRRKVLQVIGVREKQARRERSSRMAARRVMLAAAACLALTVVVAALVFPMFFGAMGAKHEGAGSAVRMDQSKHGGIQIVGGSEWKMERLETDLPSELIEGTPRGVVLPGSNESPPADMAPSEESMTSDSRSRPAVTKSMPAAASESKNRQLAGRGSTTQRSAVPPVVASPVPAPALKPAAPKPKPAPPARVEGKPEGVRGLAMNGGGAVGGGGEGTMPRGGAQANLSKESGRLAGRRAGTAGYSNDAPAEVIDGQMELSKLAEKQQKAAADETVVPNYADADRGAGAEFRYQSSVRAGSERTAILGGELNYKSEGEAVPTLGDVPVSGAMFGSARVHDGEDSDGRSRGRQRAGELDGKVVAGKDVAGIRSGDGAISRNSIDAILNNPDRVMDPSATPDVREFDGFVDHGAPIARPTTETAAASEDAVRSNAALTAEHRDAVDEVRRDLYKGEGNYNLGRYAEAEKHFSKVLETDPDNKAAKRWKERVSNARSDYYRAAYDHTRAELLSEVDAAWQLAVPMDEERKAKGKSNRGETGAVAADVTDLRRAKVTNERVHEGPGAVAGGGGDTDDDGLADADPFAADDPDAPEKVPAGLPGAVRPESAVKKLQAQMAADDAFAPEPEPEIEVVREFIYPTEFEVPEIPNAPAGESAAWWNREVNGRNGVIVPGREMDKNAEVLSFSGLASLAEGGLARELDWLDALESAAAETRQAEAIDLMAEVAALDEAFSTFSLHVSDASFRVAAAALERGERPDPEAVRPEEFYNAFDYGDPAPTTGEPVACAIEQCAHPLLPSRNLVRVGVRTAAAGRGAGQPLRLTVLLDNSGSMERVDRREAVEAAMEQLASLLGPQDVVTVVGFARQPRLLADRVSGEEMKKQLEGLVGRTPAEGGTNLEQALALADELAMRQFEQGAQNRIVLLTDGAANLGNADPEELAERIEGLRQRGVSFDAAGFGTAGMNDRMLERLTRDGNGRYYVVDGPEDAGAEFAEKLAGAFRPAAENVKVQVRFNPARVGGYRLIGFEEHRLKKEDFRDDSVDAAEMAAEEAGVAVYQVELLPEGEGEIGEVSVRFRDASKGKMVERSWTMPHDESAPSFDRAPASMQVAGLAVLAADALRDGPLAPLTDWAELAPVTNQVRAEFGGSRKVGQLLQMVERLRE